MDDDSSGEGQSGGAALGELPSSRHGMLCTPEWSQPLLVICPIRADLVDNVLPGQL